MDTKTNTRVHTRNYECFEKVENVIYLETDLKWETHLFKTFFWWFFSKILKICHEWINRLYTIWKEISSSYTKMSKDFHKCPELQLSEATTVSCGLYSTCVLKGLNCSYISKILLLPLFYKLVLIKCWRYCNVINKKKENKNDRVPSRRSWNFRHQLLSTFCGLKEKKPTLL